MNGPHLDITLRPSRIYGMALLCLYFVTLVLLISAQIPNELQAALTVVVALLGLRSWRHWRGLVAVHRLVVSADEIRLIEEERERVALLRPSSLLTSWLVILAVSTADGRLFLPLLRDSAAVEDQRRLRVWLNGQMKIRDKTTP